MYLSNLTKERGLFLLANVFEPEKKLVKYHIWSIVYGAETWTLRAVDQKHLESFEMWCWRRTEISCADHVRNQEVLLKSQGERNILTRNK
jgi:hypothetical protein